MKVSPDDFQLGADPELFLRATTPGKPWVSAWSIVPGDKKTPHPVPGGAVQHDGLAAEYNIDPARTAEEFVANNNQVLIELSKLLPEHELVNKPCVTFSKQVWDGTVKEERLLGCEPDVNAWTGKQNIPPEPEVNYRVGAGHIHIGYTEGLSEKDFGHQSACQLLAKELDIYLGMPFAWIDSSKAAVKRRKLYGKAGAHRVKSYGLEYRVLPNSWVGNDEVTRWVFENAKLAFTNLLNGKTLQKEIDPRPYINEPNDNNIGVIPFLCERHGIPLPKM